MTDSPLAASAPHMNDIADTVLPSRVICVAWGEKYIERLLRFTLPAALAPGNYPFLAGHVDCELNVVTERRFFDRLEASDVIARFRDLGGVRLTPIDDLLTPASYGLTLTLALARGFEDLGPDMVNVNLLFLNADFILADGSYRALLRKLRDGERLIMAPSYCAISERVVPLLRRSYLDPSRHLAIAPREMAELILDNLHSTVRGQIIDAPFHFEHVYIYQFYSQPDQHTLVGHQMPIAIVAMRPTAHVTSLETFWDWGAASEFCPNVQPCVLGDSDDFLMLELREEREGEPLLRLGPPDPYRHARLLAPILTADQRRCVSFPLTLHSRELPPSIDAARSAAAGFAEEVLQQIGQEPVAHRNHDQWRYHAGLLQERRNREAVPEPVPTTVEEIFQNLQEQIDQAGRRLLEKLGLDQESEFDAIERDCDADELIRRFILSEGVRLREFAAEIGANIERKLHQPYPLPPPLDFLQHRGAPAGRGITSLLRSLRKRLLGQVPFVSGLHPLAAVLQEPSERVRNEIAGISDALVVGSAPGLATSLLAKRVNVSTVTTGELRIARLPADDRFDFCYCELRPSDLLHLRSIFQNIVAALRPGAKIVALALSEGNEPLPIHHPDVIGSLASVIGDVKFRYCGYETILRQLSQIERQIAHARQGPLLRRAYFTSAALYLTSHAAATNRRAARRQIWTSVPVEGSECVALLIEFTTTNDLTFDGVLEAGKGSDVLPPA